MIGKQGYYYTMSVLFFSGILMVVFFAQTDVLEPVRAQHERVATMDDFLEDLHRDIERAAFIAGFRALIGLEEEVAETGAYLADVEGLFFEAFLNGTINGVLREVLENATFASYTTRVEQEAEQLGLTLTLSAEQIGLYHITPWEVAVDYRVYVDLHDLDNRTRWSYTKDFSTSININNLRDPLYSVETNNKLPNTIRAYPNFVEFVDDAGDANDTTVLSDVLNGSYYSHTTLAPSFLMRFAGNFSASEFGIESLINLENADDQGVLIRTDRSLVDYLYFTTTDTSSLRCPVQNMPSYFRIDEEHLEYYEIEPELEYNVYSPVLCS